MEEMQKEFVIKRLNECFHEAVEYDMSGEEYNKYSFPPMLFLLDKEWEMLGGHIEQNEDFKFLIHVVKNTVQMVSNQRNGLLPIVMTVSSGIAVNNEDESDTVRSRLFTIVSDDWKYSKIEFSDFRDSYESDEILDFNIGFMMYEVLDTLKEIEQNV